MAKRDPGSLSERERERERERGRERERERATATSETRSSPPRCGGSLPRENDRTREGWEGGGKEEERREEDELEIRGAKPDGTPGISR